MSIEAPLAAGLAAVAAGAVAYAFMMPYLAGEKRAEGRRKALGTATVATERAAGINRREQVAKTLKDIEAKQGRTKVTLDLRLARAGLTWTPRKFYVVSALIAAVFGGCVLLMTGNPLIGLAAAFAGGAGAPRWLLNHLQKRRVGQFVAELPNAVDVVVRGIRSGIPLGDCLRMISREAKEPLRTEFRMAVESQALGITVGEAVARIYERVPVTEVNFFAIVIGIQQKSGGNLSEALGNLSRVLRERRKMAGKVQAMSMEAKASAVIIAALPFAVALLTYISSPDYISLLWTTSVGKLCLAGSAVWMSLGIFTMRKMINFDI